jgi:hypothetical protein
VRLPLGLAADGWTRLGFTEDRDLPDEVCLLAA